MPLFAGPAARLARFGMMFGACLSAQLIGRAAAQDPSAGRTTPPSSAAGTAPPAGAAAPATPTTTTVEVPVAPSNTAVAPVKPGSTTTVPVNPGATTVVPVAPGTSSVIIQDPSAKDPSKPGAEIRVPIPTADPARPGGGTVIPIPGRDPNAPDGTITIVPDATKPPLDPKKPKGEKDTEAPVIKPEVEKQKTEAVTVETNDPSAAGSAANTQADAAEEEKPRVRSNFFLAARDSIFGRTDYATWEVLPFRTLFTEGWNEAWIGPPNGARGGPRQGWIGAADGNFYRLAFFSFDYTGGLQGGGDGFAGGFTWYTPLSRRLLLITQVPFVNSNFSAITVGREQLPTGAGDGSGTNLGGGGGGAGRNRHRVTGFGDLSFTPRVMLYESQNLSWTSSLTVQIPTGDRGAGGGQAIVTPASSFWWNFADRWVMRGGVATAIGTNRAATGTTLISRLAIGRTFTSHDVPIFGDFTVYVASNTYNDFAGGSTLSTIGPGFRTHLGRSYYFLGATTIPLTGPKPYEEGATFWLMKVY